MATEHWLTAIAVCGLASVGAVWDVRTGRIPNALTFPALAAGILYAAFHGSLGSSVAGAAVAGGFYFLLFAMGGMGGGDVKLGAALGAWGGFPFAVVMLILASIAGGAQALWAIRQAVTSAMLAVMSGQGVRRAHALFQAAYQPKQTVPYGVAIGAGAVAALLWPMLPGALGAWGREVYALLAAVVS
ncbi:MAG TPA: A24 family peptidase [Calditerricola sp.]